MAKSASLRLKFRTASITEMPKDRLTSAPPGTRKLPVSGSANPLTMGLRVGHQDGEAVARAVIQPGWQGAPERAHGGIVAAMVDETLGAMLPILGVVAFTGELTLRYVAPAPMGVPVEFRARDTGRDGRKLYLECEGTGPDGLFVKATSTFITVDLSRFV